MRKSALSILAAVAALGMSACAGPVDHDIYTEHYYGTITDDDIVYVVHIDENLHTSGFLRIVHLDRVLPNFEQRGISGHSGNAGDVTEWGRIFYCGPRFAGDPAVGCNSVERTTTGWTFVPCDADKDNVTPFDQQEIDRFIRLLNSAVREVRTPAHLSEQWAWDPLHQRVNRIYPFPTAEANN